MFMLLSLNLNAVSPSLNSNGDRNFNDPQHQTHYRLFTSGTEHNALRWLPSSHKMTLSPN